MDIVDRAEELVELDRREGVRRAQEAIAAPGAEACIDCAAPIEPARRAAMPSATRCGACQTEAERYRLVARCVPYRFDQRLRGL